ncbi:AraC-like DNA-binding protein [Pseudomonas sp. JAI111]|uniref:helix-turn-helix domain-containing protein n=1 Tax=Pseudomonas sp. JAI111 TaxID=2735913 RepID=UPI00216A41A8|nr:AraC family transcriptional regulator [Pseudomonas sp. JAI111]MCS3835758.1 AraC-like DNA-binding protein [Pseudomonas sp. JAI111]
MPLLTRKIGYFMKKGDPKTPTVANSLSADEQRSAWFEPSLHSTYFQIFSRLLSSRSLAAPRPFVGQARLLPLLDFLPLLDLINAPNAPDAGIDLGYAIPAAAHGPMGMAAISSTSIWHAMHTIALYAPIRSRMFNYHCARTQGQASLVISQRMPLGGYSRFMQNATLYALFNIFRSIVDEATLRESTIGLPWPPSVAPGRSVLGEPWCTQHGSPDLAIRFKVSVVDRPLETADADLYKRICSAGDEELIKLSGSISAKVRHLIHLAEPEWPTLMDTAKTLGLSRRTLARRLESEGKQFQDMLDEARNELACWYLRQTSRSLSEIAELIGFSDQGNFSRGFRRWQGVTPSEYRRFFRP